MRTSRKKVIVTRKWLMDFADTIYNPQTKMFLNLCRGTLQNGPDPKDPKRPMHCGLGELYFQLTNKQPNSSKVDEEGVINEVVERSTLKRVVETEKVQAKKALAKLKLPKGYCLQDNFNLLKDSLKEFEPDNDHRICEFRGTLSDIPTENDHGGGHHHHNTIYRARARRVAAILRKAARLLPA